ncbi:MAG: hypothetical protein V4597_00815, partial [Pseudomonadota bacterium]
MEEAEAAAAALACIEAFTERFNARLAPEITTYCASCHERISSDRTHFLCEPPRTITEADIDALEVLSRELKYERDDVARRVIGWPTKARASNAT